MMEQSNDEDAHRIKRRDGGGFERKIAGEPPEDLRKEIRGIIKKTVSWPSTSQSLKGPVTAGIARSWRYMSEKMTKYREGKRKIADAVAAAKEAEKKKDE